MLIYVEFFKPKASTDDLWSTVDRRFSSKQALRDRLASLVRRGYLEKDTLAELWWLTEKGTKEIS